MSNDYPDIYFLPEYGKLYESHEKGKLKTFTINDECGKIIYNFIKRPIDIRLDGRLYYDIITPYGYGGPIIIECKKGKRRDLIKKFAEAFASYCKKNNIVSEFIRFHPMEKNYEDFRDVYDAKFLRKTVATNLQDYGDPIMGEFTSQCRKTIRRSKREGIKVSFDFDGRTIDEFYKIYVSSMDRNNVSDFYYFDIGYFYNLFKNLKGHAFVANALLDEKIVGASVILHYGKYIHEHLTGTYPKYLRYSPNNVIKAEVTR